MVEQRRCAFGPTCFKRFREAAEFAPQQFLTTQYMICINKISVFFCKTITRQILLVVGYILHLFKINKCDCINPFANTANLQQTTLKSNFTFVTISFKIRLLQS